MARLTEKTLLALKPEQKGKAIYDEGNLRGTVRVAKDGAVSVFFIWRYKVAGQSKAIACGTWPKTRLAEIRRTREQARSILATGKDPALERKLERMEAQVEQIGRVATAEQQLARVTVQQLYERWAALELSRRKDGGAEVKRGFEKDVLPAIGHLAAEDVGKGHVTGILDGILARGAGRLANRTLSELRQMFGFGYTRGIVEHDPTHRIRKADIGGKEIERDRVLSDDEIRELAGKIVQANLYKPTEYAIWIMLSTCCRIGELTRARWENIDLANRTWLIPAENAKNGRSHTIYLSDFAIRQFESIRTLNTSVWLYPARQGEDSVCPKSITKQVADRQLIVRQRNTPMKNRTQAMNALQVSGGAWTPHDLRRTGATLMGELGIRPDVIEHCLNHVEPNRMKRIYQRQELKAEQAEAWRLLGERLELLTRSDVDNVVIANFRKIA